MSKKIIVLNGSPRNEWNTATLLSKAADGARSEGAEAKLIHLYDLNFRGCVSCFYCKRKDKPHGTCAMQDDLTPVLEELKTADGVILGSPIYLMSVTSGMFAFLERFVFSNGIYSMKVPTVFPKKIPSAFIYTMNITAEQLDEFGVRSTLESYTEFLDRTLGMPADSLYAYNTYQFDDYSKYESSIFAEPVKAAYKAAHFPQDCEKAYQLGAKIARTDAS
ncbi:flavodoxin family protein [Clostridia bacterium]|nr:flavodoxin family protein [Clostridia bacterium]